MLHLFLMGGKGRGVGLMLALVFFMLSVKIKWAKELPWDQEIVTTDFNSSGPLLVSNPLTQSLKQVSFLGKSLFV